MSTIKDHDLGGRQRRIAVVLFNLGGPDSPAAIQPFLQNLFSDPAIIGLPQPFRGWLAAFLSKRRAKTATGIYDLLGGRSPILPLTQEQAAALETKLAPLGLVKVFIAMRYWHPRAAAAVKDVVAFHPDEIVLLPLYPQFSTTTTGSSVEEWKLAAKSYGLTARTHEVCCFPAEPGFIAAHSALIKAALEETSRAGHPKPRVLFSAHGLPKKIVEKGDPYQWQVERTAEAIVAHINEPGLDWRVCYQSKVGPLEWIGPSTDAEISEAGAAHKALVVVPIAFVSDHSETLVELDIEYAHLAQEKGVPFYRRVPALGTSPDFIAGLAALTQKALSSGARCSSGPGRICPAMAGQCPFKAA